jgi:UDP-glucose 4-epimerase
MREIVLVTGGAGFIGSHLVDALIKKDYEVVVIDDLSTGKRENINPNVRIFYEEDISDHDRVMKLLKNFRFKYIFHLAAKARIQPSFENPNEYFKTNVVGTFNLLELARKSYVDKFVFTSSSSIYGEDKFRTFNSPMDEDTSINPSSHYAYQKLYCEALIKQYNYMYHTRSIILRPFNVFGERQLLEGAYAAVVGIFLNQMAKSEPLTVVSDGSQKRDFTYIKDMVEALILSADSGIIDARALNIGTGKNYSIKELADWISPNQVRLPAREGEYSYTLADNFLAKELLEWNPKVDIKDWVSEQCQKIKTSK